MKIPILEEYSPKLKKEPVLQRMIPHERQWTFSLRYWNQVEFFGLDRSDSKWFVSLLEKLKDLSHKKVEDFLASDSEKNTWRYHNINWNQKNIPLKREELNWIDSRYLDNEIDYPLLQIQVSKSLGRVVGFWDENNIFNIVLLDPLHNIQPTKSFNYRVDDCSPLNCEYSSLLYKLNSIEKLTLENKHSCNCHYQISDLLIGNKKTNILMHFISDEDKENIDKALSLIGEENGYTQLLLSSVNDLLKN